MFNLYSEEALRKIKTCDGVDLGRTNYNNLRYTDDTALIADSEEKIQRLLNVVTKKSERLGLKVNCDKTYAMAASKKVQALVCSVTVDSVQIEQVEYFKYLGSWITSGGRSDRDIRCRIGQAKQVFMDMRNLLCARKIELGVRKRLLKCYSWSVLLNGCESWTISKGMEQKLMAAEMWFWRRMMRISWTDKLNNEAVLEKVGVERQLLNTIRRRQWKFVGHVLRREGWIEKNILEAEMGGKRARGRQRLKMLDWMMERLRIKGGKQLGNVAMNRKRWKEKEPP